MTSLLAIDPSFTATGWVAVDLPAGKVCGAGLIRTQPPKVTERLTAAQASAQRGIAIRRGIATAVDAWHPAIVFQEGNAGSKSAKAAAALARAQQACVDAVDHSLGTCPVLVTPQSVKKFCVGSLSASKDDLRDAAIGYWGSSLYYTIEAAFAGTRIKPNAKVLENVYDAACVAALAMERPEVVAIARAMKGDRNV